MPPPSPILPTNSKLSTGRRSFGTHSIRFLVVATVGLLALYGFTVQRGVSESDFNLAVEEPVLSTEEPVFVEPQVAPAQPPMPHVDVHPIPQPVPEPELEEEDEPEPIAAEPEPPQPELPTYGEFHEHERLLPQHDLSLPYPDGSHAKYLWFANHGYSFGWGNYMQEMILNAYLAYASQRSYVFDNYTWNRDGPDFFLETDGRMRIARFPLSSMISGPIIGGDMPDKDVPRAVSREYFLDVCDNRTQVIDTNSVWNGDGGVAEMMLRWADKLKSIDAPCVEIASWSPTLFDYKITNTERVLDVFPDLAKFPILADLGWSPLILDGFARNYKFFGGKTTPPELDPLVTTRTPLHGLLTLHVRRGDYEGWCREAFPHSMSFVGFNSFHEFPDSEKFRLWNTSYEDTMLHCLPDIDQIIEKVLAVVTPDSGIERIYLMTNGRYPWLGELVSALKAAGSWSVATSRDLSLSFEGKHVSQALDMYVGQRSDRFIGNGFSSLTSNVVMLRMANPELDGANRTYFW